MTVRVFPASYLSIANPPVAGTPCSPYGLPPGATTTKVIQAGSGNYRRCIEARYVAP